MRSMCKDIPRKMPPSPGPTRSSLARPITSALAIAWTLTLALHSQTTGDSTAWNQGHFVVDVQHVVERSNIILQRPNSEPHEAMPLGNGRLGAAVWASEGYTAQLNRADTLPHRLSPGQVVLPGRKKLAQSSDYAGRLNLWNGEFEESGGGVTAIAYVEESLDAMVVDVKGANPNIMESAELRLWPPRRPQATQTSSIGILSETWLDDQEAGASNETFGALAAITADAVGVRVEKVDAVTIRVQFRPRADGTFRILVGAPSWRGGSAEAAALALITAAMKEPAAEHREWWHNFWRSTGLMKLSSADHAAEYFENLRAIDLFATAAESRDRLPGGQAGIGDLFSPIRDEHQWGPSAYWHWNLRMQVSANLGAGAFALNAPYFRLYRENLNNILAWTKQHMGGRAGACVPETMRFNGRGYENETWIPTPAINCGEDFKPYYNARTISTGAEVSLWIWRQYQYTDDLQFLKENFPVMHESARFLLAYANHDAEGHLHTFPSNAHETQWDVHDPTTDIAAMQVLFPAVIKAAGLLNTDQSLAAELSKQLSLLPPLPKAAVPSPKVLLNPGTHDADSVIAASYDPGAETHNTENIGLEPVWPYSLIGDDGPLHALGVRTFLNRPNKNQADWSFDPVQAARLGLAEEFESSLRALTERYQTYPSGLASFVGPEFYIEQIGIIADALQQAIVQDYDGLIRVSPAWPAEWDADATVYVLQRSRVHVQIRRGRIVTVGFETGMPGKIRIRNPWPRENMEIVRAQDSSIALPATTDAVLEFSARGTTAYVVRRVTEASKPLPFEAVSGEQAGTPKTLRSRSIGLAK